MLKDEQGHAVCILFSCQTWEDGKQIRPVLVLDKETDFWYCPKCKASYGKDAQEPFDPSVLDDVP